MDLPLGHGMAVAGDALQQLPVSHRQNQSISLMLTGMIGQSGDGAVEKTPGPVTLAGEKIRGGLRLFVPQ